MTTLLGSFVLMSLAYSARSSSVVSKKSEGKMEAGFLFERNPRIPAFSTDDNKGAMYAQFKYVPRDGKENFDRLQESIMRLIIV